MIVSRQITPNEGWESRTVYLTPTKYICMSKSSDGSCDMLVRPRQRTISICYRILNEEGRRKEELEAARFVRDNVPEDEWAIAALAQLKG